MKRKGFTLVELLIVIVVIGILSAMMMLSSTEAVTSAKASNIVSNLRNLKTAALSLYVDKLDTWEDTTATSVTVPKIADVQKYMNSSESASDYSDYVIALSATAAPISQQSWYIACKVTTGADGERVKEKLKGRAGSTGLIGASAATDGGTITLVDNENGSAKGKHYDSAAYVCMKIR